MDDEAPLLLSLTAHPVHEVVELLGQQFIRSELLVVGIPFHDRPDEAPGQFRIDRRVTGKRRIGACEYSVAIRFVDVSPLFAATPDLRRMKLEHGVVVPQRAELAEQECVKTLL